MNNSQGRGIGLLSIMGIIFVVLKLCGVITWTWILVLLPWIINAMLFAIAFYMIELPYVIAGARIKKMVKKSPRDTEE